MKLHTVGQQHYGICKNCGHQILYYWYLDHWAVFHYIREEGKKRGKTSTKCFKCDCISPEIDKVEGGLQ